MKIKIISFLLLSLSFMVKAQTSLTNDSLKGFNEKELQHHLETFKGTEKEKQEYIALVKRRYIGRKYNLGSLPPSNNFRNAGNQPGTQATCTNIDFESGNTSGWTVTGDNAVTSGAGLDPFGGFPVVHPGGNFSLQLSNNNLATSNFSSSATRVISVSPGNTFFNLHFAMDILDFPHDQASAAMLTIQFFNSSGTLLPCPQFLCEYYLDGAGNPQAVGVSNFQQTAGSPGVNLGGQTYPVTYAPWQTVAMDLTSFVGTNITCVVTCKWCIYNYDWAYCYIDADCPTSNVVPPGTCISLPASLCGPPGMGSYNWTAPAGNSVPTANTTCISATTAGVYTLDCSSIGTCSTTPYTYTYTVGPGPTASFTNTTASCAGTVNFTSTSSTNGGPAITSYTWDWGDGTPIGSGSTTPHNFAAVGTQTVTLLITNGTCIDSIKGTVVIPPHPIVNFTTVNNCLNSTSTFTSTSTATSGIASQIWNFGDASANGSGATPGHTYASAGTYTVTLIVTDNSPCTDSIKLPITINPLPSITVNAPSFCSGANTTINAGGASSYVWNPGTGLSATTGASVTANPASTTSYTIIGTDANSCVNSNTTTVTVIPNPTVSANNPTICIGGSVTLNASGATIYIWSPATGLSTTTGSSVIANPAATTTYTITGTNITCSAVATSIVTVNPLPIITVSSGTICINQQTATLTAGGASTYNWSPATGLSSASGTSVTANPTVTTNYLITGTDVNGCVNTNTTSVTVNPLPIVTVTGNTVCANATINLTSSNGGVSYLWSGPNAYSSASQNPGIINSAVNMSGSYSVTVTDANGCINGNVAPVTVNPLPIITVSSGTICINQQTATLTAGGASTYNWSPATGLSSVSGISVTANPTVTTNYLITGTDVNGCVNTNTTSVTVNPLPIVTVTGNTVCANATINLTSAGGVFYSWSGPNAYSSASQNPGIINSTVNMSGSYSVTVTDANGCVSGNAAPVTVNPLPVITAGNNTPICFGATLNLTSPSVASWNWSGPNAYSSTSQNPSIANATVNMSGTYTVAALDINGCAGSAVTTVTVNPLPIITVSSGTICVTQQTATLTAGGASIYNWAPATGLSSASGTSVTANPNVTTNYLITGTDVNGCVNTNTTSVTVNPLPIITVNSGTICINQQTATLTAGGASTYNWSPATGISSTIGTIVTANPTVTTNYLIVGTDGNGCINTNTTSVTVNPLPIVPVTGSTVCVTATVNLTSAGGVFYSWSGPNAYSANQQNPNIVGATTNLSGSYAVTVTDANGCINGNVTQVTVNPLPNVTVSSTAICNGSSGNLNAGGANIYAWNPTAGLSSANSPSVTVTVNITTSYTVTGTDINGCVNTAVSTVTVNPLPVLAITPQTTSGCAPLCVSFLNTTTATGNCMWAFGDGKTSTSCTPNHCFTGQGTFGASLTLTDNNGCVNSANASVIVYPVPIADFNASPQPTTILDPTIHFVDATVGAVISTYSWTFGDPGNDSSILQNPIFVYQAVGSYPVHLTVTSNFGCKDSILKIIKIDDDFMIYVPNAFSPNADGTNDLFFAKGEGVKDFKLYVFDRWGSQVFFSDDIYKGWDGRFQSKGTEIVQEDIYVWKIECKTSKGEAKLLKGVVSLIK